MTDILGDRFFWVSLKGDNNFEPARVEFAGGKPALVWFIGMEVWFDPARCDIAEEIVRS